MPILRHHLIISVLVVALLHLTVGVPAAAPAPANVTEAEGYACMGDLFSRKQTEQAALADAKRKAAEQAVTYIRSETRIRDAALEKDLVDAYARATVKVLATRSSSWYRDPQAGDCFKVVIQAEVVPDEQAMAKIAQAGEGAANPASSATFTSPTLGAAFVLIPAGTFTMGSPTNEPERFDNETQHRVTISRPFYLQTTEVTQGQWQKVMGNNPSYFKNCGADCPVEQVSWNDVQGFIRKLNELEKTDKYRLPTEAQWEYAARGTSSSPFNTGYCLATDQANYNGNYPLGSCSKGESRGKTVRAGSFAANAWGLHDMHGNVYEWVWDWYAPYPAGSVTDPEGPVEGSRRVDRGGSWGSNARYARSAIRGNRDPGDRVDGIGFRLLRTH